MKPDRHEHDSLPHDVSSLLEPIRARNRLPALAGAFIKGDQLWAIGATGVRKAGSPVPVTIDDQFHIGSCTKSMTATLIAMLVEDGKLSWNTKVLEVFPDLKDKIRSEYRAVTLEQLLTHRSGLPLNTGPSAMITFIAMHGEDGPLRQQRRKLAEMAFNERPAAPPGTRFVYSNHGVVIAGAMAEQIAGRPWEDLMRRRLFEPLGMRTAGFGAAGSPGKVDQPWGHDRGLFGRLVPVEPGPDADNPPWMGPAGVVHLSLTDWGKYVSLHLAGVNGRSTLLRPETLAKLHATPPGEKEEDAYAMGWGIAQRGWGGRVLTHAGSNGMHNAVIWVAPEKDFGFLIATNTADKADEGCDEAATAILRYFQSGGALTSTTPATGSSQ